MFRPGSSGSDKRYVYLRLKGAGKFVFGFLGRFFYSLQSQNIFGHVNTTLFFEFRNNPTHYYLVYVVSTQMSVAAGGFHFYDIVAHFQNGHVKSASSKVVDDYFFVFFLIKTVSQSGRHRLVDYSEHLQTGDFSRVFSRFSLAVAEISRHGDYRPFHFSAQSGFGVVLKLLQNHRRNFFRPVALSGHFYFHSAVVGLLY